MILLFLLIIPSFIFVGVDQNYFTESSPTVARVDGESIKQSDWDNAHRVETDRMRAEMPGLDAKFFDSPEAKFATLERMVRDRVLSVAAQKMHLNTSDAELVRTLQEIPAIAALRKPDGSLDADAYRALVAAQGMTPEGFESNLRRNMALGQVMGGVLETQFATPAVVDAAMNAVLQRREVEVQIFDSKNYLAAQQPSTEGLKAYYDANQAKFRKAEQVDIEYVVLDLETVKKGIELNEDDVRTYYKENAERLAGSKEERKASHILIEASRSATEEQKTKAKAKAEEVLALVRANPDQFAEIAQKESQDPGSAANGGDLGYFGRGAMDAAFETAVFALSKDAISEVVQTDFGYHIIKLTDIKKPNLPSFEAMRAQIESELRQQQAQRKYAEAADAFANMVYEQSDALKPVADKLGLKLETTKNVQRNPAANDAVALKNAHFLDALFSPESLESKRNTEAVDIGSNTMVAGRVLQHHAAHVEPFEGVESEVKRMWIAEKAAEAAQKQGQQMLEAWKADPSKADMQGSSYVLSRESTHGLPVEVVNAALSASVSASAPALEGVDLGNAGYAIVKVNKIVPNEEKNADFVRQGSQQYVQLRNTAEGAAYYEMLKKRFKVEIKVQRP